MSDHELSSIKIPSKVYVGFQGRRSEDEVPLGFMTPYDETAAGKKRQATVDGWANGYGHSKTFNSVIIDNEPMIGFKIGRAIRRSSRYSGTSTAVRIEDPRGFELEISIENLVMLMNRNIMEDCELMQECVWGRDGGKNVLLPVNSDEYKKYLDTQVLVSNKVSVKDIKPGDIIKLLGEEGTREYMGGLFPLVKETDNSHDYRTYHSSMAVDVELTDRKRFIVRRNIDGVVHYDGYSALKVEKVIKTADKPLSVLEVEQLINEDIKNGAYLNVSMGSDYTKKVIGLVGAKTTVVGKTIEELPVTEAELKKAFTGSNYSAPLRAHHFIIMERQGVRMVSNNHTNWYSASHKPGDKRSYYVPSGNSYYYDRSKLVETEGFVGFADFDVTKLPCKYSGASSHFPDEQGVTFTKLVVNVEFSNGEKIQIQL